MANTNVIFHSFYPQMNKKCSHFTIILCEQAGQEGVDALYGVGRWFGLGGQQQ